MNHAALSCKVVSSSVIVVRELFARTISSGGNSRLALATADNFDGAMIDCYCQNLLFFSEQYCELPRRAHIPHLWYISAPLYQGKQYC